MAVNPIPEGYRTVTPYLPVGNAGAVLEFVKEAFGAEEKVRMGDPEGRLMHAEVQIGDSMVMMGEPPDPSMEMPGMIHLYVEDVDASYGRAMSAGGISVQPPTDQFYGDRTAGVKDPAGNYWYMATHVEDLTPDEIDRRMAAQGQQPA